MSTLLHVLSQKSDSKNEYKKNPKNEYKKNPTNNLLSQSKAEVFPNTNLEGPLPFRDRS